MEGGNRGEKQSEGDESFMSLHGGRSVRSLHPRIKGVILYHVMNLYRQHSEALLLYKIFQLLTA